MFDCLFRAIYAVARFFYIVLKSVLRPLVRANSRLHRFALAIRDAFKGLLSPPVEEIPGEPAAAEPVPDVEPPAPEPEPEPEPEPAAAEEDLKKERLPGWLIMEWEEIHIIEPQLFPDQWLVENLPEYLVPASRIPHCYLELCGLYGEGISHVFLVPWITRGGADLVVLNYVNVLAGKGLARNIAVISTQPADSPWAERLPAGVRFIEFGKLYSFLSAVEQENLLVRVLLQMSPRVIHNINSDLGYRLFVRYGKALSSISRLYACSFCIDLTPEGRRSGYPVMYLAKCFDYLTAVMSDNATHLETLYSIYAFERDKMLTHYQPMPVPAAAVPADKDVEDGLRVLWAGRLDRQKRPDILIRIAEFCKDLPFVFHVYGSPLLDDHFCQEQFDKMENVIYYGGYDGLSSLPVHEYHLLLYTSQWDGLPNVLLEAIAMGLPVIASNVGGISELIDDGKTGFLIEPYEDAEKYVKCLQKVYDDPALLSGVIADARRLVEKRHSPASFMEVVEETPGYCEGAASSTSPLKT